MVIYVPLFERNMISLPVNGLGQLYFTVAPVPIDPVLAQSWPPTKMSTLCKRDPQQSARLVICTLSTIEVSANCTHHAVSDPVEVCVQVPDHLLETELVSARVA